MALLDMITLLDHAIELEKQGEEFYLAWAEKAESESLQAFFRFIAEEESWHGKSFEELKEKVQADPIVPEVPEEYENYFHKFRDDILLNPKDMQAVGDLAEALRLAKKQETDALLFYSDLRQFLAIEHLEILNEIIKQERSHLVRLIELEKKLLAADR